MDKNQEEIKKLRVERLNRLLKEYGINQKELCRRTLPPGKDELDELTAEEKKNTVSQQTLSGIMNGATLTEKTARKILRVFPGVRFEWLMGYDDFMRKEDLNRAWVSTSQKRTNALMMILETSLREVCLREGIKPPVLDNVGELLLLQAQLRDFSDSLMWNYVKHREHSHFWNYLDSINNVEFVET